MGHRINENLTALKICFWALSAYSALPVRCSGCILCILKPSSGEPCNIIPFNTFSCLTIHKAYLFQGLQLLVRSERLWCQVLDFHHSSAITYQVQTRQTETHICGWAMLDWFHNSCTSQNGLQCSLTHFRVNNHSMLTEFSIHWFVHTISNTLLSTQLSNSLISPGFP